MKKALFALLLSAVVLLSACSASADILPTDADPPIDFAAEANGPIVEIKEKFFIAQLNDIYLNANRYLGKTIKLEGIFSYDPEEEEQYRIYAVYRKGPGCCRDDGQALIEVAWPEGTDTPYPKYEAWVEAVGILEEYKEGFSTFIRISLTSLEEKEERGAEYVAN